MKESLQRLRSWTDLPMYSREWPARQRVLAGHREFNESAVHAAHGPSVLGFSRRHTAPPCDLQDMADQMDIPLKQELHTAVYIIDTIARPSVLQNLVNNARGYEEFIQGQERWLFAVPKQELSLPPKPTSAITFFDPDTVDEFSANGTCRRYHRTYL